MPVVDADHFALFSLPKRYALDSDALDAAWKRVCMAVHPDRFATASPAEKRVAMQWSSRANEAYRVLRDPLARARYLCELAGVDLQSETNTAMPADFLIRQMQWHERLDEVQEQRDGAGLAELAAELGAERERLVANLGRLLDQGDYTGAAALVREWMFLDRIAAQARAVDPA
jgi:molecular chaperone HscB